MHIEHGHEARTDDEIEYPLESHGDSHSGTTDGVGEYLGYKHPTDGTPREHEARTVDHDGSGCDHLKARSAERDGHAEGSESHAHGTADEEGLAPEPLDGEHGHKGEEYVNNTHEDGEYHLVVHAHILEDARSVVEHGIDAHSLLEHAEHDAHEDAEEPVGEKPFGLHGDGVLDILQYLPGLLCAVDAGENAKSAVVAARHHKIAGSLGHKADEHCEESGGHTLGPEHVAPAGGDGPLGIGHVSYRSGCIIDGIGMGAENDEINEINHELAEDDGKLVPAHKHAADVARGHLTDVHGADGGGHAHAYAAQHTIEIEHDEQIPRGTAGRQQPTLGKHRAPSRNEKAHAGENQRAFAAQPTGKNSGERTANDTADEGTGGGETVDKIGVLEVGSTLEKGLQTFFGTRDDGCVVTEQ